ncbi:MAG TPA: TonB-dependent receptor [Ferruginibacter sp.]|nr:TonB-dependent receptor [Ferruginibacter sp.]
MNKKLFWAMALVLSCTCLTLKAQNTLFTQSVKGTVIDAESKRPLPEATVTINGINKGTVTDSLGNFTITNIPIGRQTLLITLMGYEQKIVAEVLVSSGKEIFVNVALTEKIKVLDEVKVSVRKNKLKATNEFASVSARSFSVEDTRRYAASVSDPGRMAQNFAGVSSNGDMDNSIVVRGNSPKGVLWRLEGIEIPSPNHFGGLGSSGGAISMLSSSMLGNSDFYTGAFPAEFGNALSGAFDLNFRNGNKDKMERAFSIGALGIEASAEGPFSKKSKASYLFNYRYSTLALLKGFLDLDGGVIPEYQDLSFKLNFPSKKAGTFSLFGIGGTNKAERDVEKDKTKWDEDNENVNYSGKGRLGVIGLSHQYFITPNSYLKTILSVTGDRYNLSTDTLNPADNYSKVDIVRTKFINTAYRASVLYNNKLNTKHLLRAGIIANRLGFDYNSEYYDETDGSWKSFISGKGNAMYYQAYAQWKWRVNNKWTINTGLHASMFDLNDSKSLEPRASVSYQVKPGQSITISGGLHSKPEHLSTYYFKNTDASTNASDINKSLDLVRAAHLVLAYDRIIFRNIRLKAEAYYQHLYKVPVEKDNESYFSILNASDVYGLLSVDSALVSKGKGKNYGIDLSLEKPFANNFYFLFAGSVFRSTYNTYSGKEFNTRYARDYQLNLVAGKEWKPKKNQLLGVNAKIVASGSLRDSPIDVEKSKQKGEAVYTKDQYFTLKGSPYYRFDIGFSYKINSRRITQTLLFDIQNITNHKNEFYSYYDRDRQKVRKVNQTGIFPTVSYRVEF